MKELYHSFDAKFSEMFSYMLEDPQGFSVLEIMFKGHDTFQKISRTSQPLSATFVLDLHFLNIMRAGNHYTLTERQLDSMKYLAIYSNREIKPLQLDKIADCKPITIDLEVAKSFCFVADVLHTFNQKKCLSDYLMNNFLKSLLVVSTSYQYSRAPVILIDLLPYYFESVSKTVENSSYDWAQRVKDSPQYQQILLGSKINTAPKSRNGKI